MEEMIKAQQDKCKMTELYVNFLQCKGEWHRCTLVVSVRKAHSLTEDQVWQWFTKDQLIVHLGSEELALDLIARHKDSESRLPSAKKGRFIRAPPCRDCSIRLHLREWHV